MKRDRDDTDFRAVRQSYAKREPGCSLCESSEGITLQNELAYAIEDDLVVAPRRHVSSVFDLGRPEINACMSLLAELCQRSGRALDLVVRNRADSAHH